jgi:orotidine-5'-phosphate decarboxylase
LADGVENPIIVALDVESTAQALGLIGKIGDAVDFYKIGLELFTAEGHAVVRAVQGEGKRVFLDLKFHDIPETVKRATARAAELGVDLLTVHAYGQVMRAAVEGRGGAGMKLLGVTVLTSIGPRDLSELGYPGDAQIEDLVRQRIEVGRGTGIDGFVCSPLEVKMARALAGPAAVLVTPGVRSAGAEKGDQKRVATPAEAIADGASYLVIGREITRAEDPGEAARRIVGDIRSGVS